MTARTVLLASLVALLTGLGAPAQAAPLTLRDLRALVRFGTPHFSPDGARIAVRTIRADFIHDRWDSTLRVIRVAGDSMHTLVRGMRDLHAVRWTRSGHSIAFIAAANGQPPQVYEVPLAGGTPRLISDAPNGVEQFSFSPDGRTLAYVTADNSPISAAARRARAAGGSRRWRRARAPPPAPGLPSRTPCGLAPPTRTVSSTRLLLPP